MTAPPSHEASDFLEAPEFPEAPDVVVRFEAANALVHEVDVAQGSIIGSRDRRTSPVVPVLEFHIPRPVDATAMAALPFAEDPELHGGVLIGPGIDGAGLSRLFPLALGTTVIPTLVPRLATLWILHDGPFGRFAWTNFFADGACVSNDATDPVFLENTDWDVVAEVDYADCVRCYQGELEMRDLLARGHVKAAVGALSELSWHIERPEMAAHAVRYQDQIDMMLAWVSVARSDAVLAQHV